MNSGDSSLVLQAVTLINSTGIYCLDDAKLGLDIGTNTAKLDVSPTQSFFLNGKMDVPSTSNAYIDAGGSECYGVPITHNNRATAYTNPVNAGQDIGIRLYFENPNTLQKFTELFEIRVK